MPVLGVSSPYRRSLILLSIPSSDRKEFIRSHLNNRYEHSTITPIIITDQGRCYSCVGEFKNRTGESLFQHEVCRHDQNRYSSPNGYSSNRLESSFAHLKRMWIGTYQRWSRKYNQSYLNEFAWKYTHSPAPLLDRLRLLFNCLCLWGRLYYDKLHIYFSMAQKRPLIFSYF